MLTGNADGFWPPNVSSAQNFLSWYERWLDHMRDGKDNDALGPPGQGPENSVAASRRVLRRRDSEPRSSQHPCLMRHDEVWRTTGSRTCSPSTRAE